MSQRRWLVLGVSPGSITTLHLMDAQDAPARQATLTRILIRISREALQGASLDSMMQGICDCLVSELPVEIVEASAAGMAQSLKPNAATHSRQTPAAITVAAAVSIRRLCQSGRRRLSRAAA